jgi:hypothetical protein
MFPTKRCIDCFEVITGARGERKQTRYCEPCAKISKRRNTLDPWTTQERTEYMRSYRKKKKFLKTLEEVESLAIRITGVAGIVLICLYILWHHVAQFLQ